ncbi:MAG: GspE/PulE family protein [Planctomycetota bacterium]
MRSMMTRAPSEPVRPATPAGRLFNAEDFAVAELDAVAIWDRIIAMAVREQASDIHFTYQKDGLHTAVRLDGRLHNQGVLPAELGQRITNHVKVLARLDMGERRRPQDGHFGLTLDGRPIDLRVSVLPTNHGEAVAIRLLDREASTLPLEQLGLTDFQLRDLRGMIEAPSGLILVTGATGAGKTTTLYAVLRALAHEHRKIITVENPIEYDLPHVDQTQVNRKLGLDFPTLVRGVLRQDPNVIMIGEVRDGETASAVVRAANSGRLVLATTHAIHCGAALESLIALGAHPHFIARCFRGAIAQTLVRRLCPYCTVALQETADMRLMDEVLRRLGPEERPVLSLGRGCPHCRHTGYRGRIGVFEVLVGDDRLRTMISRGAAAREIYQAAVEAGMLSIQNAGKLAALRGLTTIEELMQNISEIWTGQE